MELTLEAVKIKLDAIKHRIAGYFKDETDNRIDRQMRKERNRSRRCGWGPYHAKFMQAIFNHKKRQIFRQTKKTYNAYEAGFLVAISLSSLGPGFGTSDVPMTTISLPIGGLK